MPTELPNQEIKQSIINIWDTHKIQHTGSV